MTTDVQKRYEWQKVIVWVLTLFLLGLITARSPFGTGPDRFALGLLSGTVWAIVGGAIVAIWKYFKRSSSSVSPAELQTNDKGLFIVAIVLAVFLTGKAIYFETYGALIDAAILVGLGFAVKAGFGPARWGFAIYAFISPILVTVNGGGNAVIWPFVFYYASRSLGNYVTTTAIENDAPPLPQPSPSIKRTPTPIYTPSNSLLQNSVDQPTPRPSRPAMPTPNTSMQSVTHHAPAFDEDAVYEVVANEMDSGRMDKGLWTRLFAELDGDEKKAKIAYIKQRVEKLMVVERAKRAKQTELEAENTLAASQQAELARRERIVKERLAHKRVTIGVDKFETFGDLASHAERKGFSTAKYWLGLAYLSGYVVEQDLTEARIWLEDSANEAHEPAIKVAAQLNASGWELNQEILGDLLRSSVKSADDFVVQAIVSKYPDLINEGDSNGYTALHFAANGSSSKILKYLIDNGGHTHKKNLYGKTPLDNANDQMRPAFPA